MVKSGRDSCGFNGLLNSRNELQRQVVVMKGRMLETNIVELVQLL